MAVREMPTGISKQQFRMPDGTLVTLHFNWNYAQMLARRAIGSKGRQAISGPVVMKAERPKR